MTLLNFGRAEFIFSLYMDQISQRSCSVSCAEKGNSFSSPAVRETCARNPFGVVSKATGQPGDEIISDAPFQKIITPASVGRWVEALVYVMGPLTHSNSHYTGGAAALICSRRRLAHD
jgi:hypothetical protein